MNEGLTVTGEVEWEQSAEQQMPWRSRERNGIALTGGASRSILPVHLRWGFPEEARHERFVGHAAGREHPRVVYAKAWGGKELLFSEL